jgi:hypothetical protein
LYGSAMTTAKRIPSAMSSLMSRSVIWEICVRQRCAGKALRLRAKKTRLDGAGFF